jgi:hypothetical protein
MVLLLKDPSIGVPVNRRSDSSFDSNPVFPQKIKIAAELPGRERNPRRVWHSRAPLRGRALSRAACFQDPGRKPYIDPPFSTLNLSEVNVVTICVDRFTVSTRTSGRTALLGSVIAPDWPPTTRAYWWSDRPSPSNKRRTVRTAARWHVDFLDRNIAPLIPFSFALECAVSAKTALRRRDVTLALAPNAPCSKGRFIGIFINQKLSRWLAFLRYYLQLTGTDSFWNNQPDPIFCHTHFDFRQGVGKASPESVELPNQKCGHKFSNGG